MSGDSTGLSGPKTFINPDRVSKLGLHHLSGAAPTPSTSHSESSYRHDDSFHSRHDRENRDRDYRDERPSGRQGHGSHGIPRGGRSGHGRHGGHGSRSGPMRGQDFFGYDDTVRPRPRRTTSDWDKEPTQAQREYYQQYLQRTAYPPNIQKGTPRVVIDMNSRPVGGTSSMGSEERDAVDVTSSRGDTAANLATLSLLIGDGISNLGIGKNTPAFELPAMRPGVVMPINTHDRQACRVYVGGIDNRITEQQLREFMNDNLRRVEGRPAPEDPALEQERGLVSEVQMRQAYAFVEFYNKTDAEIALSMDGMILGHVLLRVKSPKEMLSYYAAHPPKKYKFQNAVPSTVENGPNKIFLGSIPRDKTDLEIREIVESIGKLSAFNLVKDTESGLSKGYAFFTYVEPNLTERAISVLNGYSLASGHKLSCSVAGCSPSPLPITSIPSQQISSSMQSHIQPSPFSGTPQGMNMGMNNPSMGMNMGYFGQNQY